MVFFFVIPPLIKAALFCCQMCAHHLSAAFSTKYRPADVKIYSGADRSSYSMAKKKKAWLMLAANDMLAADQVHVDDDA